MGEKYSHKDSCWSDSRIGREDQQNVKYISIFLVNFSRFFKVKYFYVGMFVLYLGVTILSVLFGCLSPERYFSEINNTQNN